MSRLRLTEAVEQAFLAEHAEVETFALVRPRGGAPPRRPGGATILEADIDDAAAVAAALATARPERIVHLAGQNSAAMGDILVNHLNATADTDHERIGVIGAPGSSVDTFLGHTLASDRVVLVAPGIVFPNGPALPPAYAAAAVTGMISGAAPQTSLTNMPVNVPGLTIAFNRGQQQQLIQRNVVAIADKEGFRVIKGVTTAGQGTPFSNISIRRIVDYAKYGVRSGANSYLGRLNNSRVRGALKATLDAFLTRMVQDEMLVGYDLSVTATRDEEIKGIANVTMTLQPTFSIDFIKVTMFLQ